MSYQVSGIATLSQIHLSLRLLKKREKFHHCNDAYEGRENEMSITFRLISLSVTHSQMWIEMYVFNGLIILIINFTLD